MTPTAERASGTPVEVPATIPSVTLAPNGEPSVAYAGQAKPAELIVQPLIAGAGAPVAEGNSITVHYSGWLWDGASFDSSWGRGESISFVIARGSLIDGWVDGLVGQPVGSQVLLVVPPEKGYGNKNMGPIPPGSTLVFVVDILAAN